MKPTSHFLAFSLPPTVCVDIYVGLQKILGKGSALVEFQNPLSSHITLGYFPAILPETPEKILAKYKKREIEISFSRMGMFGGEDDPKVYFLSPDQIDELAIFQKLFLEGYPDLKDFAENTLDFIPHMTLFRVMDRELFLEKREEVASFLNEKCQEISQNKYPLSLHVFSVYSQFHPEIQIQISSSHI